MNKKKVLVVVDYQNDFVTGTLGFEKAICLDSRIAKKAEEYINDPDGIVIVTFDSHDGRYLKTLEGKKLPVEHCIINTEGHKLYGETGKLVRRYCDKCTPYIGEYDKCVLKTNKENLYLVTKDTFGSLELGELLKELNTTYGIAEIRFGGIVTNMCVISNVVISKAACPSVEITVDEEIVDSFNDDLHEKALDVMEGMQVTVE